jgi:hypothetical protein
VAAANAVAAGIAASDALCGRRLGRRSSDADHMSAATLIAESGPDGGPLATQFRRLIADKSTIQYGGWCTAARAESLVRIAWRLVDAIE